MKREMRVVFLAFSVRGAMGQYIEALTPHLSQRVELHLFVPDHYPGQTSSVSIHRFRTGKTRYKALLRFVNPFIAWNIWEEILGIRPDLIHIFNGEGYPWGLLFSQSAYREGIPVGLTLHDPELHPGCSIWEYANAIFRKFVIRRVASVHVHSKVFVKSAQKLGARHIVVIPHGSIAERFTKYKCSDIAREPIALFFGRLEAYKGLDLLVEAGLILKGKLRIIIAGPGRLPARIVKMIREYPEWFEVRNRFIPDDEVAFLFQKASVLVLPYKQATQSSLPLIAAAFGLPVVATSVGAFVEDVPRVGGILVPPGNVVALAEGMLKGIGLTPVYPRELEMHILADQFLNWYRSLCHSKQLTL